jgi:uncharacterized membrane protein YoaK (UPF0700 family)
MWFGILSFSAAAWLMVGAVAGSDWMLRAGAYALLPLAAVAAIAMVTHIILPARYRRR